HRPQRGGAALAVVLDVASGQPDADRLAGRAAGRLDADDPLQRRALGDAKEGAVGLRRGDLGPLHARDPGEVLGLTHLPVPDTAGVQLRAVEVTRRRVVDDLLAQALVLEAAGRRGRQGLELLVPDGVRHDPDGTRWG